MTDTTATAAAMEKALMDAHQAESFGVACQAVEDIRDLIATLPAALAEFASILPSPSGEGVCVASAGRHAEALVRDLGQALIYLKAPGT
jgi:hypothetical protein